MVVAEAEVAEGPAYRIEIFDQSTGRIRALYLFDGVAGADEALNRHLLTCASRTADDPFWEAIAESAEVFDPAAPAEEPMAEEAMEEDASATE